MGKRYAGIRRILIALLAAATVVVSVPASANELDDVTRPLNTIADSVLSGVASLLRGVTPANPAPLPGDAEGQPLPPPLQIGGTDGPQVEVNTATLAPDGIPIVKLHAPLTVFILKILQLDLGAFSESPARLEVGLQAAPTTLTEDTETDDFDDFDINDRTTWAWTNEMGQEPTAQEGDRYLLDPASPNHFYQVANGVPYRMPCPKDLLFDPTVEPGPVCVWLRDIDNAKIYEWAVARGQVTDQR